MNLDDMMRQAGGGNAFAALGRQYGLSEEQMRAATEALMPALAYGLKRNTADPASLFDFMQTLSTGRHAAYYDDPSRAWSPSGVNEGNAILGHLFGSPEVSRAVARQVQASSGISEAILKQMLPVIASMVLGGLFKQGQSGGNSMLEQILRQMTEGMFGGAPSGGAATDETDRREAKRARRGPLDRYEDAARERPRGQRKAAGRARQGEPSATDNPFGRMFEDMMGGMLGRPNDDGPAASPRNERRPAKPPRSGTDMFGELFEPGRRMGEAQQKNMEAVFDQFLQGMDRFKR